MVLQLRAVGVQIYICQKDSEGKPAWVLKAPEAELYDHLGQRTGRHSAGPAWKHADGSEVTAKLVTRVDAPEPQAIPWLLLSAAGHSGNGVLSRVTTIQRVHTRGGQPPPDCQLSDLDTETRVEYAADYYFFAPAQ